MPKYVGSIQHLNKVNSRRWLPLSSKYGTYMTAKAIPLRVLGFIFELLPLRLETADWVVHLLPRRQILGPNLQPLLPIPVPGRHRVNSEHLKSPGPESSLGFRHKTFRYCDLYSSRLRMAASVARVLVIGPGMRPFHLATSTFADTVDQNIMVHFSFLWVPITVPPGQPGEIKTNCV